MQNTGGWVGAWVADVMLSLFGYVAYLLPIMVALLGWRIFEHRKDEIPPQSQAPHHRRHRFCTGAHRCLRVGEPALRQVRPAVREWRLARQSRRGRSGVGLQFHRRDAVSAGIVSLGVTLTTGLSWLKLMDRLGHLGIDGAQRAREFISTQMDRLIGMRAKKQRREVVEEDKRVLEKHPAPRIEPVVPRVKEGKRAQQERQAPLFVTPGSKELPPLSLLDPAEKSKAQQFSKQSLESMARLLEKKLLDFDIEARVVAVHPGPIITLFEMEPAPGVKASQITNLQRDLARALSVVSLRVVENIPGKNVMGIEIPNESRETVRLTEVLSSQAYEESLSPLTLALGKDIAGNPVVTDLNKMPHLLIAGTTSSGKSVCINTLILSLVYKSTPEHVRLVLIDPKMLELSVYDGIPHLLAPVVTDMKQAANVFKWSIAEMDRRYRLMSALGVRNLAGYNRKVKDAEEDRNPSLDPITREGEEPQPLTTLPMVVILVDELADLMMVTGKKVEELITRLAQKARAAGLHLVLATNDHQWMSSPASSRRIFRRIAFRYRRAWIRAQCLDQMGARAVAGERRHAVSPAWPGRADAGAWRVVADHRDAQGRELPQEDGSAGV